MRKHQTEVTEWRNTMTKLKHTLGSPAVDPPDEGNRGPDEE